MSIAAKKKLKGWTIGDYVVYGIMILFSLIFLAPFVYVVSVSLTDPSVYVPFKLYLLPEKVSLKTYEYLLSNPQFLSSLSRWWGQSWISALPLPLPTR